MEQLLAERLTGELKIDITQVVREYWEITFLKSLFESPPGNDLVFKGGTAIRLAYGSPRFSEDLDFNLLKDTLKGSFEGIAKGLAKPFLEAKITDLAKKRWTYLCEIRITEAYLAQPFRVKLEISRRPAGSYENEMRLLTSPTAPLQALGRVATLEQLYHDKLECIEQRAAPKDIFDIWFISQKLGVPYSLPKTSISPKILRRDLAKYLPTKYHKIIEGLI